ncbi:hypothetical protein M427DRAFT_28824 [Gonapodya prolifera JEL478]|uniref:Uncharacterized protein n=1 Tax=Gonapodya prolifera (strain JEL478) TaxID=1344416 RepID=A0A139ATF0_GONPJ|nr:hypothetical protein M427DRAFT_28824 [Gonapodya prolifera JEL478]|eukprot:KXS19964.1 hypothetical protein M427DRAFT_28824 [Gonapodya prolifera JEL478]
MAFRQTLPDPALSTSDLARARIRKATTHSAITIHDHDVETAPFVIDHRETAHAHDSRRAHGHVKTKVMQSITAAPFWDDKGAGAGGGYMDATEHLNVQLRHRHVHPTQARNTAAIEDESRRRGSYPFNIPVVYPTHWDPESIQRVKVTDWSASIGNPSPFGLYAFSVATMIFGFINIGVGPEIPFIMLGMNWAIIHAGAGQVLAGIYELNRGQTFAGTTFTTFGLFWLGLGLHCVEVMTGVISAEATTAKWPVARRRLSSASRFPTSLAYST